MEYSFRTYCIELVDSIPHIVYILLLVSLGLGVVLILGMFGFKRGLKYSVWLLLIEYIFLLLGSTIIYRKVLRVNETHLTPLGSYHSNSSDVITILPEHIMNVVVFIPVGLLIGLLFKNGSLLKTTLFGFAFSCLIESLQFLFKRGTCEIDDVMNNTLGCFIGAFVIYITRKVITIYKY